MTKPHISKIAVAVFIAAIAALLLFARADDSRLGATVSADKPNELKVYIGGDAIRDQIYPDFKASFHMAEISGGFRILRTGETGQARLSSEGHTVNLNSYETKGTLNLEPGELWDLEAGDQIAVEVKVGTKNTRTSKVGTRNWRMSRVLKTDYIYITVSCPSPEDSQPCYTKPQTEQQN